MWNVLIKSIDPYQDSNLREGEKREGRWAMKKENRENINPQYLRTKEKSLLLILQTLQLKVLQK